MVALGRNVREVESAVAGSDLGGSAFSLPYVEKALECGARISLQRLANFRELHNVNAPLAAFNLRNEGLRIGDALPELSLCNSRLLAESPQEGQEGLVMLVVGRARHTVAGVRQRTLESDSE